MKKIIGILVTIAMLALIVFGYLRIGQKAGTTATEVMKESRGQVDNAKQAVEELNKSSQETDKALEQVTGKKGE